MTRPIGAAVAIAACLLLCGCWSDQKQALNTCLAGHPYVARHPPAVVYGTRMAGCMSGAGYRPDLDNASCKMAAVPRRDAYCYAPNDFWQRAGYRIEMLFRPGPAP